jgi:hypothetical protein
VLALGEFRCCGFADATFGAATRLTVRVKQSETEHTVSVGRLEGGAKDPMSRWRSRGDSGEVGQRLPTLTPGRLGQIPLRQPKAEPGHEAKAQSDSNIKATLLIGNSNEWTT